MNDPGCGGKGQGLLQVASEVVVRGWGPASATVTLA